MTNSVGGGGGGKVLVESRRRRGLINELTIKTPC
jgi:hypothetical protein